MQGLMKDAKMKAIMDIISQMDDMELSRLMPKDKMESMDSMESEEMAKPEKKGITIVKLESNKTPEIEMEDDSEEEDNNEEESIDPYSALARIKARMKMKGM